MENHQEIARDLERIGLSEKESLVYASLLSLGGAYPSKIAEETKLNRSTVYKILVDLSVKGLVNEIEKRNKIFYQVEKPDRLIRYAKSRISHAEDNLEIAKKLLPDFEGLYSLLENKPRVRYFEKIEGVLAIYEDFLSVQKPYEMLAFSNAALLEHVLPKDFFQKFRRSKERIGITTRGIIPDTKADLTYNERMFAGYDKKAIPKLRIIPSSKFPFKGEITIYGENKVSIVNLSKEHLTGIIIEDAAIHGMMRMIFELAWDSRSVKDL